MPSSAQHRRESLDERGRLALARICGKMGKLNDIAAELTVPERVLLFCIASGTEWARAGVTGATATAMVVRGLIERDSGDELTLTKDGRAVLEALLGKK
jgi:hypothetical protein